MQQTDRRLTNNPSVEIHEICAEETKKETKLLQGIEGNYINYITALLVNLQISLASGSD